MAVVYQDPLREVREPEQIEKWIEVAESPDSSSLERRRAISRIRGAINVQRSCGHRAAVVYLKKVVRECSRNF